MSWDFFPGSGSNTSTTETATEGSTAETRLAAVLDLVRTAHSRGQITREQLTQVERAAGIEPPAPKTITITLQISGDTTRLTDGSEVTSRIETSLAQLARSGGMEIVRGSTTVDVG